MAESAVKGHWDAPGGEVREVTVPADARKLCTLAHVGYEDAFLVEVGDPGARTPEEWVRVIIESAPAVVRRALWPGWTAIGLKLHPTTDRESVLGWEVHRSTPEFVLLAAGSRIGMPAQLLLKRNEHALLFSTFVQHDNQAARAVWAATEPMHLPIVRRILSEAASRWSTRTTTWSG